MSAIQHLRLQEHKGLKGATLTELGRINVLCGPNNSGKTTTLECIANPKLCIIGMDVTSEEAQRIATNSRRGVGWGNDAWHNGQFIQAITNAVAATPIWFSNESQKLIDSIDWSFAHGWANYTGSIGQEFPRAFPALPEIALIPAKRRLDTSKQIDAFDQIRPDGSGVLNFLFAAKNQDGTAPSRKHFDSISSAFQEISAGYEFDVFIQTANLNIQPPPTNVQLRFRQKGGMWIQAVDCGLGLQELLIVLYFALASEHGLVLIEEPENHLHPDIQRRLIRFLREKTGKQFFLSTHSSVFLNTQFVDRVFACRMTDSVHIENATSRATLLADLGYSIADNLVSDLIVLCEGPTDKPVLEEFFHKMGLLDHYNIKVWPLGGDIMDQLDLTVFQEAHQLLALIDGDPGSSPVRKRFLKKCQELSIPVTQLKRYSLENYFSLPAIRSVMKGLTIPEIEHLAPEKAVSDQLGFEVKKNGGRIAKEMTLEDVKGTDFEAFLKTVRTLIAEPRKK